MVWQRLGMVLACCGVAVLTATTARVVHAQQAGVEVRADGVLRTKTFHDPTGQLNKQKIAAAKAKLNPDIMRASDLRMISINRLEADIAALIAAGRDITDDMRYLAGLTRIKYVFFYPETNDIVIAGPAEGYAEDVTGRPVGVHTGRAIVELQDLIVALRAFAPAAEPTKVIGVSIDPTQQGLARMQQFLAAIRGRVQPSDAMAIAAGLKNNLGLQTVSIRGVSDKTHFAQVLVEADYRMKKIGIGLEETNVGITSYVSRAKSNDLARNALQRWFFTPNYECVKVSDDSMAMELVGNGVQLMSEDELVTMTGGRVRSTHVDRASEAFVSTFTEKYGALADQEPVYAQLRNLIDLSIAAAFIQKQDYYAKSGWDLGVFANEADFAVEVYHAPKQVETAVNAIWKGNRLLTPVGGGVNMQPRMAVASRHLLADENGATRDARAQIEIERVAKDRWWWD